MVRHIKERRCEICGDDISHRGNVARYCEYCQYLYSKFVQPIINNCIRKAKQPRRYCLDCGKDITHTMANRERCDSCQKQRLHEKWLESREVIVAKKCIDCGDIIVQTPEVPLVSKRCKECQKKYRNEINCEYGKKIRKEKPPKQAACVECGKILPPEKPLKSIYCQECKEKAKKRWDELKKAKVKYKLVIRHCKNCDIEFEPTHGRQVRCKECQEAYEIIKHKRYMKAKKEKRRKKRNYLKHRDKNIEVIVGVDCIICGKFVLGHKAKKFCDDCKSKWYTTVPEKIVQEIAHWPSFKEMPDRVWRWKKIMEFRREYGYQVKK